MPFNEIQFGGQHSQKMKIQYVRDNYLRCDMSGYVDATISYRGKYSVDVSRPNGLRRMDYDGSGVYSWVDPNTRKILSGDNSGEHQQVQPKYAVGEEVYVTKLIADPTNTSGNKFSIALYAPTTVDIFVDENREGRNWSISGEGGGIPSGYKPKCIVFCEEGSEISGQVLFKSGCDDTEEGVIASGTTVTPCSALEEETQVHLYYGPKGDEKLFLENMDGGSVDLGTVPSPSAGFSSWLGQGTPLHGFKEDNIITDGKTPNEIASYALGVVDTRRRGATVGTITVDPNGSITNIQVSNGGAGYLPDEDPTVTFFTDGGAGAGATATAVVVGGKVASITVDLGGTGYEASTTEITIAPPAQEQVGENQWAKSPDTVSNYAVVSLPSGTLVSTVRVGKCTYTIPCVGEKVAASVGPEGGNKFEATSEGGSYYLISDSPSKECFGCGSYYIGIKPSGEDGTTTTTSPTGIVTAFGYLAGSPKCTEESPNAELASTGNVVLTLGCEGESIERKVPSITVFGRGAADLSEVSFATAGVPDFADGDSSNYPYFDYASGICLVSSGPNGNPAGTICESVLADPKPDFPVDPAGKGFGHFRITFSEGKVNQVIVGYNKDNYPIYSWIPHVGTTGLCDMGGGVSTQKSVANLATSRPSYEEYPGSPSTSRLFYPGHLAHRITDNQYYAFKSDGLHPRNHCPDGSYDPGTAVFNIEPEEGEAGYDVSSRYNSLFYLKLVHVGWQSWGGSEEWNTDRGMIQGNHSVVKVTAIGLCPGTPYG